MTGLLFLAVTLGSLGDRDACRACYQELHRRAAARGDHSWQADGLRGLGVQAIYDGDYDAAWSRLGESISHYRAAGDRWLVGSALSLQELLTYVRAGIPQGCDPSRPVSGGSVPGAAPDQG